MDRRNFLKKAPLAAVGLAASVSVFKNGKKIQEGKAYTHDSALRVNASGLPVMSAVGLEGSQGQMIARRVFEPPVHLITGDTFELTWKVTVIAT